MATTVSTGTLSVQVKETISIGGYDHGATNSFSVASIKQVVKRLITVTTTEVEVIAFGTASSTGTYIESDVRYLRFTNKDDTNHITLTFKDEDNTEFAVLLDKGQSFIYNADLSGGLVDTMHAGGSALTVSLNDLVNVTADADTASCDMEMFVATV